MRLCPSCRLLVLGTPPQITNSVTHVHAEYDSKTKTLVGRSMHRVRVRSPLSATVLGAGLPLECFTG